MLGLSGHEVYGTCDKCFTDNSLLHEYRPGYWICSANTCVQEDTERDSKRDEQQEQAVEDYRQLVLGTKIGD